MSAGAAIAEGLSELTIRTEWRPGDAEAVVDLHRRLYPSEYGVDESFVDDIAVTLEDLEAREAWPSAGEGVWFVDAPGRVAGSLMLSDEGDGEGRVRLFALEADLRGHGLGRRMFAALMRTAREGAYERLTLATFSDLTAAAHLYRGAGFQVVREEHAPRWGRETFNYQHYELRL
jgi:ribosomal protein S18 acetylase RimI-like enzyme